ncbi:hypothetical protein QFZ91_004823 [Paraburkholderia sp. JPY419]
MRKMKVPKRRSNRLRWACNSPDLYLMALALIVQCRALSKAVNLGADFFYQPECGIRIVAANIVEYVE